MTQAMRPVLLLMAVLALLLMLFRMADKGGPKTGRSLGTVQTELIDNGIFRLSDYKGEVVVVNFWATWCGPCREESRLLNRLHKTGVRMVGLAIDPMPLAELRTKAHAIGIQYPVGVGDPALIARAALHAVPTTCVVGRDGLVTKSRTGMISYDELASWVDEAR
jgi:cytochrome c biogenesis protein CcmG/thiol:disulfide interchange protein DsbE